MDTVPTTIEKWYTQALHFKHVWEKTNDIAKGEGSPFLPFQERNNNNQKIYQKKKDPNAMDVDAIHVKRLTPEEQQRCIDNNLCFKCRRPGHSAAKCRNPFVNKKKQPATPAITKIEEIPDNDDSITVGRISTMDF